MPSCDTTAWHWQVSPGFGNRRARHVHRVNAALLPPPKKDRLYALLRRALARLHVRQGGRWVLYEPCSGREVAQDEALVPGPMGRGGGSGVAALPGEDEGGGPQRVWLGFVGSPAPAQRQRREHGSSGQQHRSPGASPGKGGGSGRARAAAAAQSEVSVVA